MTTGDAFEVAICDLKKESAAAGIVRLKWGVIKA